MIELLFVQYLGKYSQLLKCEITSCYIKWFDVLYNYKFSFFLHTTPSYSKGLMMYAICMRAWDDKSLKINFLFKLFKEDNLTYSMM